MTLDTIYYVFEKSTGEFMGSGTPYFDDEVYGCTTVESLLYNPDVDTLIWDGSKWNAVPK